MPNSPVVEVRVGTPRYPVLDAFRRDRSRRAIIRGPLGSGKTFSLFDRLLQTMCEQEPNAEGVRPTRWLVIRNTYSQLETTTIRDFRALFTDKLGVMTMGNQPSYRTRCLLEDGTRLDAEVIFLALDREDAVTKLRGFQLTGGITNETKELVKPIIDMLDLRVGRYPSMGDGGVLPTWHGIIGDTNAPDTEEWLYKLAEEQRPEGWAFFHQPGGVKKVNGVWVENPDAENLHNLPPGYYVIGMQGKSEDWISVNLGNEYGFSIDGKPVHPAFSDSLHCGGQIIPYNPAQPIVLGVDFGRTPAAAILQPALLGRYNVIDEFVTDDMSQATFGPELKRYIGQQYPGARIRGWADPAGTAGGQNVDASALEILNASVPVRPAPSNAPTLRRAALENPLMRICMDHKPALLVSAKCTRLRKGLAGGWSFQRLKVAGQERFDEKPNKGPYSHVCEALEYALLGEGEGNAALMPADYNPNEPLQEQADMW